MDDKALQFLTEVLGSEGASALSKTEAKEPALANILIPRAALAWLAKRETYEGTIPGVDNSYLKLNKSDSQYTGVVSLTDGVYSFESVTSEHVAAAISLSVGMQPSEALPSDGLLVRLGKSIDFLAQAQVLAKALPKTLAGGHVAPGAANPAMAPIKQDAPTPPGQQPTPKTPAARSVVPKLPKKPKLPGTKSKSPDQALASPKLPKMQALKVEKSELSRECDDCGRPMFKNGRFSGCMCLSDMAKSVKTVVYSDGVVLEANLEPEAFQTLTKALRG